MSRPLAYFLTWTTHGTWLHGDERLSVDREHSRRGTPMLAPDPQRSASDEGRLTHHPFTLTPAGREIVDATIRRHCEVRRWKLPALNVRSNHVHVVVSCPESFLPENVMNQFKAWCTRRLRQAGLAEGDRRIWTEHGSTRWINHSDGLVAAIDYMLNWQD